MKLLFCDSCWDVFKLADDVRECECGKCKGRYMRDGHHAETNGEGFCLALNNHQLMPACAAQRLAPADEYAAKEHHFEAWVRGHDGPSNPRSTVNKDL